MTDKTHMNRMERVKAPLINGIRSLRDLKRTGARRASPVMALALGKKCNAATVRFRARPSGPTGCSALCVASFRQVDACLTARDGGNAGFAS